MGPVHLASKKHLPRPLINCALPGVMGSVAPRKALRTLSVGPARATQRAFEAEVGAGTCDSNQKIHGGNLHIFRMILMILAQRPGIRIEN